MPKKHVNLLELNGKHASEGLISMRLIPFDLLTCGVVNLTNWQYPENLISGQS